MYYVKGCQKDNGLFLAKQFLADTGINIWAQLFKASLAVQKLLTFFRQKNIGTFEILTFEILTKH